jgi:hypothetical protein
MNPCRAASLRSTGIASSRLPSSTSACSAISGALEAIFSFEKSRKWIIRCGLTGISRGGSGASIASGLKKSRGCLTAPGIYRAGVGAGAARRRDDAGRLSG